MRQTLNTAAYVLAACSAAACLAGCASKATAADPGSAVNPGGPRVTASTTASAAASSTPTRPAKPAAERVPDSSALTVTVQTVPGPTAAAGHANVITNAKTIAQIAADINALPTLPHYTGIVHCPMETVGSVLTLDFRDSADGTVLAEVRLTPKPTGQCSGGVEVTVGGVTQPQLDDSAKPKLFTQLEQLAGLTAS